MKNINDFFYISNLAIDWEIKNKIFWLTNNEVISLHEEFYSKVYTYSGLQLRELIDGMLSFGKEHDYWGCHQVLIYKKNTDNWLWILEEFLKQNVWEKFNMNDLVHIIWTIQYNSHMQMTVDRFLDLDTILIREKSILHCYELALKNPRLMFN